MVRLVKRLEAMSPIDRIVPDLYEALCRAELWPDVLMRIQEAVEADGVHLELLDARGRLLFSRKSHGFPPESGALYYGRYAAIDPTRKLIPETPVGDFFLTHRRFDRDFLRRSEYYNDFFQPLGFLHSARVRFASENGYNARIGFAHRVGREPIAQHQVKKMRLLLPHLKRAVQLMRRLAVSELSASSLVGLLDRLEMGALVVDGQGGMKYCNQAGEQFLRSEEIFAVSGGRLSIRDPQVSRRFEQLVVEAAQCAAGNLPYKSGGELAVPRPNQRHPLLLLVAPLTPVAVSHVWREEPAVVVFIRDSEPQILPLARLSQLFGLTWAEARLAAKLAADGTLDSAADEFQVSKHTLRVQLRGLMRKTRTNRQATLVRLLSSVTSVQLRGP
jgi:DNA-binding CsgD family transcriptional regulator/PAS domain-containing protein